MQMAESTTTRAAAREDRIVDAEIEKTKTGLSVAIFLSVVCVFAAIGFLAVGMYVEGGIIVSVPFVLLVRSFLFQR